MPRFAIIAMIAVLSWRPRVAEGQNGSPNAPKNQTSRDQKPVPPTHIIIEEPIPTVTAQVKTDNAQNDSVKKTLPQFLGPEWIIVYVTAAYVLVAWWTLSAIKRQAKLMERQLVVSYRAFLVAGQPYHIDDHSIGIEIKNNGHVSGIMTSVTVELSVWSGPENREFPARMRDGS